jgi:peptidoglycan/LPS O-acetylase OafA/YrhL
MIGLHKNISTGYFDGIRGIAVLLVWLSHSSGRDQAAISWLSFHGIGHVGVMLFFVLSGYLLSLPICDGKTFNFKKYIIRRFLRIAPLYYSVLAAVFIYQQWTGTVSKRYLHIDGEFFGFIKHLLFIKGDSLFWTISAEFVFYLILPLVALFLSKKRFTAVIFFTIVSLAYSFYHFLIYAKILELPGIKFVQIKHASQFFDVFIIGVVFGFLSSDKTAKDFYKKHQKLLDNLSFFIFIFTILITFIFVAKHFLVFNQPLYLFRFISIYYAFAFGLILLSTHYGNTHLRKIFELKLFMFCGIVGYSWYLLHFPILAYINIFDLPPIIKLLISTALISIIALAGYKFIEEPFIKIGKNISYDIKLKT